MFSDIGGKCKKAAKMLCYAGITCSILAGLIMIILGAVSGNENGWFLALYGLLIMLAGSVVSWLSSIGLYAIGESAENSAITANLAIKADLEREKEKNQKG